MSTRNYTLLFIIKGSALNRGMNTGIENLAWGLAAQGCSVHILSGGTEPGSHSYDLPATVTYHFTGFAGAPSSFMQEFLDLSARYTFDAVIGWIKNIGPLSHLVSRSKNAIRPVFIANQGAMTGSLETGPFLMRLLRRFKLNLGRIVRNEARLSHVLRALPDPGSFYRNIDHVVSITRAVQENVQHIYCVSAKKCSVVNRGVDTGMFAPSVSLGRTIETPVRVLYTGNVIATKGVGDVVDAVGQLSTPVRLVLCGNGSPAYIAELTERLASAEYGANHILDWRGPLGRSDVVAAYQAADLFVFCSSSASSEGLGKSLIEAMSCGLPVVVSDIPPFCRAKSCPGKQREA